MIVKCTCKHEYQDAKYGVGMRVHTIKANGSGKCTVCGKIAAVSSTPKKK